MKLLVKFPTRNRPDQFFATLQSYARLCHNKSLTYFLITLDADDTTMADMDDKIHALLHDVEHKVVYGSSTGKIHAINRDMDQAPFFDVLLLASDDMIPEVEGYDDVIRQKMRAHYPNTDGVLWFNDGYAKDRLNTLVCMGRKYYQRFGYIYDPLYKSFFCDNAFMDKANQLKRQTYFPDCIIRHQHPANTGAEQDDLYRLNDRYWNEDERTYFQTKHYDYDLSVLICSLADRRPMLQRLLKELKLFKRKSSLNIEILTDIDNGVKSIGQKRNDLVARAQGKYCCFIDDDDQVSPAYFVEIEQALQSLPDCVGILGMFYRFNKPLKPFVHSADFNAYAEDEDGYYRPPNHLNPILTGFVKRIGFPTKSFGEDTDFAMRLCQAGLIQTEGKVRNIIYHYYYNKL